MKFKKGHFIKAEQEKIFRRTLGNLGLQCLFVSTQLCCCDFDPIRAFVKLASFEHKPTMKEVIISFLVFWCDCICLFVHFQEQRVVRSA